VRVPSQDRAARTRQRIIVAAAEAVNEASFEKASLTNIASRAGVTTGALYFHFAGKDDLVLAMIEAQNAFSQRKAMAILELGLPTFEAMLRVSADLTYDILRDPLVRAGARLTGEVLALDRPPTGPIDDWLMFNVMMLTNGQGEGVFGRDLDVEGTAEYIVAGYLGNYLFSTVRGDLPGLVNRILRMWLTFVRAFVREDIEHWSARAVDLFLGTPLPTPLTIDEATDRHLQAVFRSE
jgi:AcrR family transcriptional regulator